jgi:hypothetical protein
VAAARIDTSVLDAPDGIDRITHETINRHGYRGHIAGSIAVAFLQLEARITARCYRRRRLRYKRGSAAEWFLPEFTKTYSRSLAQFLVRL